MGQLWSINTQGGYMYSDNLSQTLRMSVQPTSRFRQFADIKDAAHQGKEKGETFHWNVYSKLAADDASEDRALNETTTMPNGGFTITQGTMTITEYGIAVPYTKKLDDLSEQPVKEVIHKVLKDDCAQTLDRVAAAEFNKTPLRVVPTSGTDSQALTLTTNSVATATNSIGLGKEHVKTLIDIMKERNIPAFDSGDYYSIAWPTTYREFKNDLEATKFYTETGFGHIMRGELGRYEGCRFVEQTNVAKTAMGTAAAAWTNAKSNWAFFFGSDTVAEAVAVPEEIRGKLPGDYGRDKGIAWYYLGGFGICHTDEEQARIIMWDSAA